MQRFRGGITVGNGVFLFTQLILLSKGTQFSKHITALTLFITEPKHSRTPTVFPVVFVAA